MGFLDSTSGIQAKSVGHESQARTALLEIRDRVSGSINVKNYGAVGDGVTDDTAAFTAALGDAAGKTLVARGTFRVGQINLISNLVCDFRGAIFWPSENVPVPEGVFVGNALDSVTILGGWWIPAAFTPVAPPSDLGPYPLDGTSWLNGQFGGCVGLWFNNSSHIVIDGGRFDGLWTGVNLYDTSHSRVSRTKHTGGIAGIAVVASAALSVVTDVQVDHNQILGCGDDGIAIMTQSPAGGGAVKHVVVDHNYIDKSRLGATLISGIGIRVENSLYSPPGALSGITVDANVMVDMVAEAMETGNLTDSVISNNTVVGYSKVSSPAYKIGIAGVAGVGYSRITGNGARGSVTNNAPAMTVAECTHIEVASNHLSGNSALGGIAASNTDYSTFAVNMVANPGGPGIVTSGSSDHNALSGNDLASCASAWTLAGTDNALTGNRSPTLATDITRLRPSTAAGAEQTGAVYQGSGAPSDTDGSDGDAYFRTDTPGTVNQRLYVKSAGAWTGIL